MKLEWGDIVTQVEHDTNLRHRANGDLHHTEFENISPELALELNALTNWQLPK